MLTGLLAGLASGALFGVAAAYQARAVRALDGASATLVGFVRRAVADPLLLAVVAAYLVGFVLHAVAIWLLPLYLAQSTIALQMPVTALCAAGLLGERVRPPQWAAVGAVVGGIVLLSVGAGEAGEADSRPGLTLALALLLPVLVLLGVLLLRGAGGWRMGLVGALSGLGYAGSALAVRGVEWSLSGAVVVAALLVPLLSVVAFWLYSAALDRTEVTAATSALIVVQTAGPTLVGIGWLGDGAAHPAYVLVGVTASILGAVLASPPEQEP